ncbi:MAG: hypothetical protein HY356_07160, partial [Gammaproteobacteria bacterium]|nr:hypothetical protein [Gammaproteobacteria bacterium]
MYKFSALLIVVLFSVCSSALAIEPVLDQQVMLYYSIPFGGDKPQDKAHKFGLRFDQITHAPGEITEFSTLMKKPAAFDLQSGNGGSSYTLRIHGVDYTERLSVHRADAEAAANVEAGTEAEPEAEAGAAKTGAEEKTGTEEAGAEAAPETGEEAEAAEAA